MEEIITNLLQIALTAGVGIIAYFLKRTIERQDCLAPKESVEECKKNIGEIERECKKEIDEIKRECKKDVSEIKRDFATRRELDEIKQDIQGVNKKIDFLSENTVRSNDFIRTMTRIEDKIDDIRRTK